MKDLNTRTILVTGASGKLGTDVVRELLETHNITPSRLIVTTRSPEKLSALSDLGVRVRAADFDDVASLQDAFAGADALLLISGNQLGKRLAQHSAALAAAEAAGVQHLVYTSMPAADASPVVFAPEHGGTEARLRESSLPGWSILRNNWYFDNLPEVQASVLTTGVWFTSAGDARVAQLSRADLGRAAAAGLVKGRDGKRTLTPSGAGRLTVDRQRSTAK